MPMLPSPPGPWSQMSEAHPNPEENIFHRRLFQVMGLWSRPRFPGRPGCKCNARPSSSLVCVGNVCGRREAVVLGACYVTADHLIDE
jgi:hypothetical protein